MDTVSATRRAAVVNFLMTARNLFIVAGTSDKKIEALFERFREGALVIEVVVRPVGSGKFTALIGCQIQGCAEECSHHLDMLMLYKGEPICQSCYEGSYTDQEGEDWPDWHDLPAIGLEDLKA